MSIDTVAAQLWGTAPKRDIKPDLAGLGPAPRAIDSRLLEYTSRAVRSWFAVWVTLAVFFGLGDAAMLLAGYPKVPALTVLFVTLAVYSFRTRSRGRRAVLDTLRNGELVRATVLHMRAVETRGKYGRVLYVTYHVGFRLPDGHTTTLVSRDGGLSLLQIGLEEEVVWWSENRDVVVPTYLLI